VQAIRKGVAGGPAQVRAPRVLTSGRRPAGSFRLSPAAVLKEEATSRA